MIEKKDKELINNNLHLTINQMVDFFNKKYTKKEIKNFLSNNNISCQKENKETRATRKQIAQRIQTPINHNYFKTWTHNMAYVLGIWYADGCIFTNKGRGYYFSIKLNKKDKYLLQLILDDLNSLHNIYENNDGSVHITISSKTIYQDLIALGGKENKSLSIILPNVPDEYMYDFIRGYFDGDGSLHCSKNGKTASFVSTYDFCMTAKKVIEKELNIHCSVYQYYDNGITSTLQISGGKQVPKFLSWIYDNCDLKLERKYLKYLEYFVA